FPFEPPALHDALPISGDFRVGLDVEGDASAMAAARILHDRLSRMDGARVSRGAATQDRNPGFSSWCRNRPTTRGSIASVNRMPRSAEHTSELQSRENL